MSVLSVFWTRYIEISDVTPLTSFVFNPTGSSEKAGTDNSSTNMVIKPVWSVCLNMCLSIDKRFDP